jgi:undecaprenyl-diphosphatase
MISVLEFDKTIFVWINTDWSNSFFDVIMPWVTRLGDTATVSLWIVFIAMLMSWQVAPFNNIAQDRRQHHMIVKAFVFGCLYMVLIYCVNVGAYVGLKHLSHRARPFVQQNVILRISPATVSGLANDSSFPSGHACNAFMIAALLAKQVRRKRYVFYGMAALVALSRVYLGVHYPSDVIMGACVGLVITWLMLFFRPLRNKITREGLFSFRT